MSLSACNWFRSLGSNITNKEYVDASPAYHGIQRVVVFVRRLPCYAHSPALDHPGADFITSQTQFYAPLKEAVQANPRAVDVDDMRDEAVAGLIVRDLERKGYQPFLVTEAPLAPGPESVSDIMSRYRAFSREQDAFLFCFYSPTLFVAEAGQAPPDHLARAYSLQDIINRLAPGRGRVLWAGPRAGKAPGQTISHAHIYVTMSLFRAADGEPLWQVADSRVHGKVRVVLAACPPSPTDRNYWADAEIIRRLMLDNLKCRLTHLVPDAIPAGAH